ncbi:uncharacterized protein PITG_19858 [Phytophthora infestans T30-4]|uniref:Glycosyl transferase family 1 domain-containing protein n=1 Tax=Phytophthora infestans (strain T30-4) TaxID=403677 RepID=D0P0M4_PHYIT|nr:uncharacterized protein PITG_19858 [Phytophthora infestans T30-4]EEY52991.1 conserved hypothetical protein [Phytophthora infestans T30-4]|eukprot:XP_002896119.1 conserved hypothetical protein [Phytophthora infestans T30-4]
MPNIEMFELTAAHFWRVDVVLCKTHVCYDRVTRWYSENGSPRNVKVFYTKHTSSDQAEFARQRQGSNSIAPKDCSSVKFIHTAGSSVWKGTRQLVDCWILSPGMLPLDVYIDDSASPHSLNRARSPVQFKHGMLEPQDFNKLIAESAFFMCPSRIEGYGHYLNQARASGGVMLLGGNYEGERGLNDTEELLATFNSSGLCNAYHEDTKFFAQSMHKLRQFTRN